MQKCIQHTLPLTSTYPIDITKRNKRKQDGVYERKKVDVVDDDTAT